MQVECGVHISKGSVCLAAPLVEKGDHCIPIGDLVRNTNADCHSTAVKGVDLDCQRQVQLSEEGVKRQDSV